MHMDQNSGAGNPAPIVPAGQAQLAARLAAIRAQINAVISAPGCFGGGVAQRRRRDEDILLTIAADLNARLVETT